MGESLQGIQEKALKIMSIVEAAAGGKDSDMPQASWNFYEMFQALIQVGCHCLQI